MDRRNLLLVAAGLLLTSLACSFLTNLTGGSDQPPAASGGGEVIYTEDFGDPDTGWEIGNYDTGTVGYLNGVYAVSSYGDGNTMWGLSNQSYSDTDLTVDATQVRAPGNDNNDYGVICRLQSNEDGYYLLVSGDGFYAILKSQDGEFNPLVDWTDTGSVREGNSTNEIRAICQGSSLSLYVNGDLLASTSDSTFSSGDIALTATSYEADATEIHFDNLIIRQP